MPARGALQARPAAHRRAFYLKDFFRGDPKLRTGFPGLSRLAAAVVPGVAICGLHYTGSRPAP
ncbi:hypothetical protein CBM2608_B140126 [Cupriavidus taiwanensis]|nr:hypothetical protein CBM2608_B140126 [Cupriavidus taiwanensis]